MMNPKQEKKFEYKGFPCVILFMPGGYRCGYVGLPKEEKKKIDTDKIQCHCGITYKENYLHGYDRKDKYWIGFDCAHACDGIDIETAKKNVHI